MRLSLKIDDKNFEFTLKQLKNDDSQYINEYLNICYSHLVGFFTDLVTKYDDQYDVVKCAVGKYGQALGYASDRLKANYDIVKYAVKADGLALEDASEDLRTNYTLVKYAIKQSGRSIHLIPDDLKTKYILAKCAVKQHGCALEYVIDQFKSNYKIVKYAIKNSKFAFFYASDKLRANYGIARCIPIQKYYFEVLKEELKEDQIIWKSCDYRILPLSNPKEYSIILLQL